MKQNFKSKTKNSFSSLEFLKTVNKIQSYPVIHQRFDLNKISQNNAKTLGYIPIISEIGDLLESLWEGIVEIVEKIVEAVARIIDQIAKELSKIDWSSVFAFKDFTWENFGKILGNILVQINPVHLIVQGLKTCPLTSHLFNELDKLTGGLFSTLDSITTLPMRWLRGDSISKLELLKDALFLVRVGSIIISGGTMVSIVNFSTQQLKQGTLGQTALGRDILGVLGVIGGAMVSGTSITQAAEQEIIKRGMDAAKLELIKHTPLGESDIGRLLIGVGTGMAAGLATGLISDANQSLETTTTNAITKELKAYSIAEAAKAIPFGDKIASSLLKDASINPWQLDDILSDMTKAARDGLLSSLSQETWSSLIANGYGSLKDLAQNAVLLPVNIVKEVGRIPDNLVILAENIYDEAQRTPENIARLSSIVYSRVSELPINAFNEVKRLPSNLYEAIAVIPRAIGDTKLSFGEISFKAPTAQEIKDGLKEAGEIFNTLREIYTVLGRFLARRRIRIKRNGRYMWAWELEDGSWFYDENYQDNSLFLLALAAAGAVAAISLESR